METRDEKSLSRWWKVERYGLRAETTACVKAMDAMPDAAIKISGPAQENRRK